MKRCNPKGFCSSGSFQFKILITSLVRIAGIVITLFLCFSAVTSLAQESIVRSVYFKSGSYKVDRKFLGALDEIGRKCKTDSLAFLKIFAYTDTVGSAEYNDNLAKRRAAEVCNYLVDRFKINRAQIYATWLGEESEGYDLHFEQAHLQERCVDIIADFKRRGK